MNRYLPLLRISIFCLIAASAIAEDELPKGPKELIQKLNNWEHQEVIRFNSDVAKKRKEVVEALQKHKDEASKSGNLDEAIAIKTAIEDLEGQKTPAVTAEIDLNQMERELKNTLVSSKWRSRDHTLEFKANYEMQWNRKKMIWSIVRIGKQCRAVIYYESDLMQPNVVLMSDDQRQIYVKYKGGVHGPFSRN